jgi:y4mF family transcriptional regulator
MSAGKFETASQKLMRELIAMSRNHDNLLGVRAQKGTASSAAKDAASRSTLPLSVTGSATRPLYDAHQSGISAVMKAATGSLDKRMEEAFGLNRNSAVMDAIVGDSIGSLNREMASGYYSKRPTAPDKHTSPTPKLLVNKSASIAIRSAADLGPLVRKARKAMQMTQNDFAAHAGVGRRFLSELEGGKPSLEFDKVLACAEAAGIEIFSRSRSSQ